VTNRTLSELQLCNDPKRPRERLRAALGWGFGFPLLVTAPASPSMLERMWSPLFIAGAFAAGWALFGARIDERIRGRHAVLLGLLACIFGWLTCALA
jgi:hypothetical protein